MSTPAFHPHGTLSANLAAFTAELRTQHGFLIGPGETLDALRALEYIGVANQERVRAALRLVLCAGPEQARAFDAAFEAFFLPEPRRGVAQQHLQPRHTRPQPPAGPAAPDKARQVATPPRPAGVDEPGTESPDAGVRRRVPVQDDDADAAPMGALPARYSSAEGAAAVPAVPREGLDAVLEAAGLLIRRLRVGRSRRWRALPTGNRFDFRRTLRGSLQTGGEPLRPRWQGHPLRNPRMLVVVDGSRSMSDYAGLMLQFAYALSQRTRRLDAFVFSTALADVTRQLRRFMTGAPLQLADLHASWGGGTRIGACLSQLVREHGHRCLSEHTLVLILSDGLDVGEPDLLCATLRTIRRRCAGLVWLNPLLGTQGYSPEAQSMRAALPYLDAFLPAGDVQGFIDLARSLQL
jgi:uncharacterized protein with von Willebrand factor type A (vWA) domain